MTYDLVIREARVDGAVVDAGVLRDGELGGRLRSGGHRARRRRGRDGRHQLADQPGGDALREQAPRRWVLRGGRVVAETVVDRRLDRA